MELSTWQDGLNKDGQKGESKTKRDAQTVIYQFIKYGGSKYGKQMKEKFEWKCFLKYT